MREPLPTEEVDAVSTANDPLAEAIRRADLRALWPAIEELPRQQRDALLLREFGGMSYAELVGRARGLGVCRRVAPLPRAGRLAWQAPRRLRGDHRRVVDRGAHPRRSGRRCAGRREGRSARPRCGRRRRRRRSPRRTCSTITTPRTVRCSRLPRSSCTGRRRRRTASSSRTSSRRPWRGPPCIRPSPASTAPARPRWSTARGATTARAGTAARTAEPPCRRPAPVPLEESHSGPGRARSHEGGHEDADGGEGSGDGGRDGG